MANYSAGSIAFNIILNGGKHALSGLKNVEKSVNRIGKAGKEVNKTFDALVRLLGFAGTTHMVFETSKMGRSMELLSDQTGIAAGELSKLKTAFSAAGVNGNKLESVLQRINKDIQDTTLGIGSGRLAGMYINARDEFGKMKKADTALREMAVYAQNMLNQGKSSETVSNALMSLPYGIDQQMANILMQGPAYFDELITSSADKFGSLSTRQISNLSQLQKSIDELKTTAQNTGSTVISELAPELKAMADVVIPVLKGLADKFKLKTSNVSREDPKMLGEYVLRGKGSIEQKIFALEQAGIKDVKVRGSRIKLLGPDGKWTSVDASDVYKTSFFNGLEYFKPSTSYKVAKGRISALSTLSDFAEKRKEIMDLRERINTGAYTEEDVDKAEKYGMLTQGEANTYRGVVGARKNAFGDLPEYANTFMNPNEFNRALMLASYGNSQQPVYVDVSNEINHDVNGNTEIKTTTTVNGESNFVFNDLRSGNYGMLTGGQ